MSQHVHVLPVEAPNWRRRRRLAEEVGKFGSVGAFAFIVDVGLFNLLLWGGTGILGNSPLTAKTISVAAATAFSFLANRFWTYRDRARTGYRRETALFLVTNVVALGISAACLYITHYLLGMHSPVADNVSGNLIGIGLGTMFRFWAYRNWVFPNAELSGQRPLIGVGPNDGPRQIPPRQDPGHLSTAPGQRSGNRYFREAGLVGSASPQHRRPTALAADPGIGIGSPQQQGFPTGSGPALRP